LPNIHYPKTERPYDSSNFDEYANKFTVTFEWKPPVPHQDEHGGLVPRHPVPDASAFVEELAQCLADLGSFRMVFVLPDGTVRDIEGEIDA